MIDLKFLELVCETVESLLKRLEIKCLDYMKIDTQGAEFEILKGFDFKKYDPVCFTIEHNFTNLQKDIDEIMKSNNYLRIFKEITAFDAWYVRNDVLNELQKDTSID